MATPTNLITKYTSAGVLDRVLVDYTETPGDSPTAMVDYDDDSLLVLIENAGGRRIEKVFKDGSGRSTFIINTAALSLQLRSIALTPDLGFLASKSTSIEKFSSAKARVTQNANPYISAPAGSCATATTLVSKIAVGVDGTILTANSVVTPNNKINLIASRGYTGASDCVTSITGPTTAHVPVSLLVHSSGKLFVAYGNNTGQVHDIYSYDLTASTISNAVLVARDATVIQGVSSMAEMPDGSILLANAASAYNTVEQFDYSLAQNTLTRRSQVSFITPSFYSRSISEVVVGH